MGHKLYLIAQNYKEEEWNIGIMEYWNNGKRRKKGVKEKKGIEGIEGKKWNSRHYTNSRIIILDSFPVSPDSKTQDNQCIYAN